MQTDSDLTIMEVGEPSMRGFTTSHSLDGVIQYLSRERKTGMLRVECELGAGKIYFLDGEIYDASPNESDYPNPVDYVHHLVRKSKGTFVFCPGVMSRIRHRIGTDAVHLLLLGAVEYDQQQTV